MNISLRALTVTSFALAALASGCATTSSGGNPNAGYGSNAPLPGSAQTAYSANDALARRVLATLSADARIGAQSLTVQAIDGVVEIGGNAQTVGARDLALETARHVPGVRTVRNNMVLN